MKNLIAKGDNFSVLKELLEKHGLSGKVDLVYIDPPYGTNQHFTFSTDRFSTISRTNGGTIAYSDTISGEQYLEFLSARLLLIRELMSEKASIYLHIGEKMGHYVRVLMDRIFGEDRFVNQIARIKCNPKNFSRKGFGNSKDMILFYSKSAHFTWNEQREPFAEHPEINRFSKTDEKGKKYTTTPIHAPGETANGITGKEWKGMFPPPGRHWRYAPQILDGLDQQGLIEWSSYGNPRKKLYEEDARKAGLKIQDIWAFKDPQNPRYPTEKNRKMLELIVKTSSNPGDLVLDAFCGAGTTLEAAQHLGRRFIGIDSSPRAIDICRNRLLDFSYLDFCLCSPSEPWT